MAEEGEEKSPKNFAEIEQADLEAIRKKAAAGQVLTETELRRLRAAEERTKSGNGSALEPIWAKNQVELAKLLRCSRKTISRSLKIEGDEAPPASAADGRYNVTAWKIWAADHGKLRKTVEPVDRLQALEQRAQELKNEKLELENAVRRGELMHVDDVCQVLTDMVGGFVAGARGLKHGLAPSVVGLSVPEATKRIGHEIDTQLTRLALGEWAKKKIFWSSVYARLRDLQTTHGLGVGLSSTS